MIFPYNIIRNGTLCTNPSTKYKLLKNLANAEPLQPRSTLLFSYFHTCDRVLWALHPPERGFRRGYIFNKPPLYVSFSIALRHVRELSFVLLLLCLFPPLLSIVCFCCWLWPGGCIGPNELCLDSLASFQSQHPGSICPSALMWKHTQQSLGPLC